MLMKPAARGPLLFGAVLLSALLFVACGGGSGDDVLTVSSGALIKNVTIVSTRDGTTRANMAVAVDNGKIVKIDEAGKILVAGSAQLIDATGKSLVPGYLDMHTHVFDVPDDQAQTANLQLLIANGVTGFREMSGSAALVQRALQLNADSAAGRIDAPEVLIIPGDIFVGTPPASTTAAGAIAQVQQQKAYGAGFIKVVNVNREASLAVLSESKNQGLYVAGHLLPALSAKDSSDAGWKAIEHLGSGIGILLDCANDEVAVRDALLRGEGGVTPPLPPTWSANALTAPFFQRVDNSYNDSKCQSLAQTFAKNGTWHIPTLIKIRSGFFLDDAAYRADPNLNYVSKTTRAAWEQSAQRFPTTLPATAIAIFRQHFVIQQTMPKLLRQNGVKMLAGSDISLTRSPFLVPGFALHQEFRLLAASGLSPLEILQMATLNGAEFLNRESTMGTVETGKNADLVLLDANPIADVANLDAISGVFLKGKYFSKTALDLMKTNIANAYGALPLNVNQAALYSDHAD